MNENIIEKNLNYKKDNEKRMTMNPGNIRIKNEKGNFLDGEEAKNYLKEKLQIGEVVKLQKTGKILKITSNDGEVFKYSGTNENLKDQEILFNQEDIEKVIKN